MKRWTEDEIELLYLWIHEGITHKDIAIELGRSVQSIEQKAFKLNIKSFYKLKRTTKDWVNYLNKTHPDITCLGNYINSGTKILHKHSCGFEWDVKPNKIQSGRGCPNCAISGFQPKKSAVTYLIYFPNHDLYKFGITNNLINRLKDLGNSAEIIFTREFDLGTEAIELENNGLKMLII